MIYLKEFKNWTSTVTDDVDISYGDKKPELSDVVKFTEYYINDNFDNIHSIDLENMSIEFKNLSFSDLKKIKLNKYRQNKYNLYNIYFDENETTILNKYSSSVINITEYEYDYLCELIYNIDIKLRENKQKIKLDNIISKIDPVKRDAKKYNL